MLRKLAISSVVATFAATGAQAVPVSLELMLLTDVSGSVDDDDYDLIREGYAQAFEDATVQQKILDSATGSIAVALSFFDNSYEGFGLSWALIDSAASANAFATSIRSVSNPGGGSTGIAEGITGAAAEFINGFEGQRNVIDVTGDGSDSVACSPNAAVCAPLQTARDDALAGGIDTINALFVNDRIFFGDTGTETIDSIAYGNTNVIGGTGAFVKTVGSFLDFEVAIRDKIIREITPPSPSIPVPAAGWLMMAGLGSFAAMRRRKSTRT